MASESQSDLDELARKDEAQYVHQVYETIASHFSSTRYKVGSVFIAEVYIVFYLSDLHSSDLVCLRYPLVE